jgi:mono/diheme cytochrome c family protein
MSTRSLLISLALSVAFGSAAAVAETPGLGKPITEADIKAWNLDVLPDGTNLPAGSGTPAQGAPIFSQKCAMCHGDNGVNPKPGYGPMVGLHKFDKIDAPKTVTYYEYATTLFDVIRRSMPYPMPKTLTDAEVYALTAYILSINKLIGESDVINAQTLPKVKMPMAGNFIVRFPDRI